MPTFIVPVRAVPKGSTRAFNHRATGKVITRQTNADALYEFQDRVAYEARKAGAQVTNLPTRIIISCYFARPKAHISKTGKLKESAARHHTKRPDLDKLVRAVLDALTGVCWLDDSQVWDIEAHKEWCDPGEIDRVGISVEVER